jgi:2'-5' RNA ligase
VSDHAFLAVDLSEEDRHALSAALTDASSSSPIPGKRPPARNWHITLRFLGDCTDVQADQIMFNLSETVDVHTGRVWCNGLGAFPRPSKAGVIYAAIDDQAGLLGYLAAVCSEAAMDAGFVPEDRPYVPHLTLARLRPALDVRTLFAGYGEFRAPIAVSAVTLMRTRRTRSGIHYDMVARLALP